MRTRPRSDSKISFSERMATAFVSVFLATCTLALYPLALFVIGHGGGGGGRVDFAAYFYAFMLSKVGVAIVIGAGVAGFCLGSERMANIFSFFWGTHGWWKRVGAYLDDKADVLRTEYNVPVWSLIVLLLVVFAFVIWKYAA